MSTAKPLTIVRGKTLERAIRWEAKPIVRKAITAISLSTGAPRLTVAAHGIPDGWRGYCYGIKGTKELNVGDPERVTDRDYLEITVIDANTVEFNAINAADFGAYVSGGFLAFYTPRDLTGYICRVKFKDRVGGTVLLSTELADAPLNLITATVDNALKKISILVDATDTAALAWKKGVWEAEMESPTGIVDQLVPVNPVTVVDEVVTP